MVLFYVNAILMKSSISEYLGSTTIAEGVKLNYNKYFNAIPGKYAQDIWRFRQYNEGKTNGAIALRPLGNLQGGVGVLVSRQD